MVPGHILVAKRFSEFNRELNAIWQSYSLLASYLPEIHKMVKKGKLLPLTLRRFGPRKPPRSMDEKNTYGAIDRVLRKVNPRQTFITSVMTFEDYLGHLMYLVYKDFPGRLLSKDRDEAPEREEKL